MHPIWHSHTTRPEQGTVAIIAHRDDPADFDGPPLILYAGLHMFDRGQWVSEDGGVPITDTEFWWAAERDLLALVPVGEAEVA